MNQGIPMNNASAVSIRLRENRGGRRQPMLVLLAVLGVCLGSAARAATYQHHGDADPLTEGWVSPGPVSGNVTWGPANSGGTPAWFINDADTVGQSGWSYRAFPTAAEEASGFAHGWSLRMTAEVLNHPDDPWTGSIVLGVAFARGGTGLGYSLALGAEADGDPILSLAVGTGQESRHVLDGLGDGFHTYELRYDPVAGDVDVLVDNSLLVPSYTGFTHPSYALSFNTIEWGSGSSADTGYANYSEVVVTFTERPSVVPEGSVRGAVGALAAVVIASWIRRRFGCAGEARGGRAP